MRCWDRAGEKMLGWLRRLGVPPKHSRSLARASLDRGGMPLAPASSTLKVAMAWWQCAECNSFPCANITCFPFTGRRTLRTFPTTRFSGCPRFPASSRSTLSDRRCKNVSPAKLPRPFRRRFHLPALASCWKRRTCAWPCVALPNTKQSPPPLTSSESFATTQRLARSSCTSSKASKTDCKRVHTSLHACYTVLRSLGRRRVGWRNEFPRRVRRRHERGKLGTNATKLLHGR
mmetsp:Transcript_16728/g.52282  ORF Transcript_16728/g.52282 Transcript_16728/m.52282 type:complete len:232 (-) Transcript_16728:1170-1865(-)